MICEPTVFSQLFRGFVDLHVSRDSQRGQLEDVNMTPKRVFIFTLQAAFLVSSPWGYAAAPKIGDQVPAWRFLQGTDGLLHSRKDLDGAKILVVAFLCNKCP